MTKEQWFKQYDETVDNFKWFILTHFQPKVWLMLCEFRRMNDSVRMILLMNQIWLALPDGRFNVMENPKGWNDFLFLLESPPVAYTCDSCKMAFSCKYANDEYNTNGDCLAMK